MPESNLFAHFGLITDFMNEAVESGGGVLVHCMAGISRSSSVVIAFLMKVHKLSFEDALPRVKAQRPVIAPNYGFVKQLKIWEQFLVRSDVASISGSDAFTAEWTVVRYDPDKGAAYVTGNSITDHVDNILFYLFYVYNYKVHNILTSFGINLPRVSHI